MKFFGINGWKKAGQRGASLSSAFTMIEMLIVIAMLGILMGTAISGVGQAKRQAKVARANTELRELVNAWLSYEQAYDEWPAEVATGQEGVEATESNLRDLLGQGSDGLVYLNAPITSGAFRDPWGTPYKYRIVKESPTSEGRNNFEAAITFPNRNKGWR